MVYAAERHRLRRLAAAPGRSTRELRVAGAAQEVLALSGNTPHRGLRGPESRRMEMAETRFAVTLGGDADISNPKRAPEADTLRVPKKKR